MRHKSTTKNYPTNWDLFTLSVMLFGIFLAVFVAFFVPMWLLFSWAGLV